MRIDRLVLRNFKGFEKFDQRMNKRFTLIVGKNGAGKSSVLDALSVAFGAFVLGIPVAWPRHIQKGEVREASRRSGSRPEFNLQYPAMVEAEGILQHPLSGEPREITWKRELRSRTGRTTTKDTREIQALASDAYAAVLKGADPTLPLLSYYGTGRLWSEPKRMTKTNRPSRFDAYRNSHEPRVSAADLLDWLKHIHLNELETMESSPVLAAWRKAVEGCFDEPIRITYSPSRERLEVTFEADGQTVAYGNLSHGQRNILSMVGDIAYKAIVLNPHLGAEAVNDTTGIILIDEIDLHLHPTWQRNIIPALLRAFPRLQFIAATHSPFVIQSLCEGVMLDLDKGELDDRVYNIPIGRIIEGVHGIKEQDHSESHIRQRREAESYLTQVDRVAASQNPMERERLERVLDEMEKNFQNPGLEALMKVERITRLNRANQ